MKKYMIYDSIIKAYLPFTCNTAKEAKDYKFELLKRPEYTGFDSNILSIMKFHGSFFQKIIY